MDVFFDLRSDDLLQKYKTTWDKVSTYIKIQFCSESIYSKNYLKAKMKSHGNEVTDFYEKTIRL